MNPRLVTAERQQVERSPSPSSDRPATLVAVATYNEIENLPALVDEIFRWLPQTDLLVVDDNSPDGTGRWCEERAAADPRVRCIHREGKLGLGSATIAAMRQAIERDYTYMVNLDADFSHPPRYLAELIAVASRTSADVVIGSRYVSGGTIRNWPLARRLMSRGVNLSSRLLLGLPVRDTSGAFRCYRTSRLAQCDLDAVQASGYAFCEEILWHLKQAGASFAELPIEFIDREHGQSKVNHREAASAVCTLLRLGAKNWLGV